MFRYSEENVVTPVAYCSFEAMHTRVEFLFVHRDRKEAESIAAGMEKMVREEENRFSRHLGGSGVSALNGSMQAVPVDDGLYFALELCEQFRKATCGYFDIAALSGCRERPAYLTFPQNHSARRTSGQVVLDFGGFAKGYALERARRMLREAGVTCSLLNFGDSSVASVGSHPHGESWTVSPLRSPGMKMQLRDSAFSISGNGVSGREHIKNPLGGDMASKGYDIGVTGTSALICEVLSTALYAAPETVHNDIMASFKGYEAVKII